MKTVSSNKRFLSFILVCTLIMLCAGAPAVSGEKNILFILDTSSSMKGSRINMAKTVILESIKRKQRGTEIAVRIFKPGYHYSTGQYSRGEKDEFCEDSELVLDFIDYDMETARETIDGIKAKGPTPLAQTLDECVYDFLEKDSRNIIIVLTDGYDSCGGDPCDRASYLRKRYGITINVIGLGVDKSDRNDLLCIAEKTGGKYFDICNRPGLLDSVFSLIELPESPLVVILTNKDGEKIFGDITIYDEYYDVVAESGSPLREFSPTLPVGTYSVEATVEGVTQKAVNVVVSENAPTEITLQF